MAKKLPKIGGVFMQAESEVAAINMVYGAASTGKRVMTSSSSPGISLKQEGISYISGAQLPAVIVNIMRGGPGLGGIQPSQSDYFQATKGGGHGDYHMVVLAPASVQELYDMTVEAFNIADRYRIMTMILGDGVLGQMMEVVNFRDEEKNETFNKSWAANGHENKREHNMITSIHLDPAVLEQWNIGFQNKYKLISENEQRYELYNCEDAEIILVAYGSVARICKGVIKEAAEQGIKLGLIRPITLFPFPVKGFEKVMDIPKAFLTVEMSAGQMVEDVRLTVNGRKPVYFTGRMGGMIPTVNNIMTKVMEIKENNK